MVSVKKLAQMHPLVLRLVNFKSKSIFFFRCHEYSWLAALVLEACKTTPLCKTVRTFHITCRCNHLAWGWWFPTSFLDLWCSCSLAFGNFTTADSVVQVTKVMSYKLIFILINRDCFFKVFDRRLSLFDRRTVTSWESSVIF